MIDKLTLYETICALCIISIPVTAILLGVFATVNTSDPIAAQIVMRVIYGLVGAGVAMCITMTLGMFLPFAMELVKPNKSGRRLVQDYL
jgi:hypothetical protein